MLQNKAYGYGMRVFTSLKKPGFFRCTICEREIEIGLKKTAQGKGGEQTTKGHK